MSDTKLLENIDKEKVNKITDWENAPTLKELLENYNSAKIDQQLQTDKISSWLDVLDGKQELRIKKGRSKIVPKVVRKQAEWRYATLSEPFLSTTDLFRCSPRTYEDTKKAEQNQLILNYQFNCLLNKVSFIDELIRTIVDEGTAIVQIGWEYEKGQRKVYTDIIKQRIVFNPETGEEVIEEYVDGQRESTKEIVIKNQPKLDICHYKNIIIDPTCNGDLDNARFVIHTFETSLAELRKDGKYKNLDNINLEDSNILSSSDEGFSKDKTSFTYQDNPRKRIIAKEYWGYWDIHGTGEVESFVATWIGDTIIRMEENPFPHKKPPFVAIQYIPVRKSVYGEPDAALLEDNQKIIGAVTRGIIDIIGRSANGQQGIRKDALDITNSRKFEQGDDYKFNSNIAPSEAFYMEKYPEIPRSAMEVIQMQNNEAESLSGIKAFSSGISGQALGHTATAIRSALDASSKRELDILRRIANGITQIGRKIISMNAELLEDEEIIRLTNEQIITIDKNDLGGNYDIKLEISTAESDNEKASELGFMLQTMGNNLPFEMTQLVLSEIARLRKMPELAKRIETYQQQPDPVAQERAMLENELLKARIALLYADAQDREANSQLRGARINTESARARQIESEADLKDLKFVEEESGVPRAHEERMAEIRNQQEMKVKEHDHLSELDKQALIGLNKEVI